MRILHIIESLGRGGAEQVLTTVTRRLDKKRFSSIVYSLFDISDFREAIEKNGVPVFSLGLRKRRDLKAGVGRLYGFIKRNQIDIVHTHLFFANIYGRIAAKMANVKCVVTTLHNPDYTYEDNGRLSFKLRRALDRYTGRFINTAFIAVSEAVKRDYVKWMGFRNIKVLYNSIDLEEFRPDPLLDIQTIRGRFGVDSEDCLLLNIGRLHPQKGQIYLIEAMRLLKKETNIKFKLLIVGEGNLREDFVKKIDEYNLWEEIRLIGKVSDVRPIIQASDIFVFPSVYEALGVALIEAMAMKRPVIATAVEGLLEVVTNGRDGLLVSPNDPKALAETILRLYQQGAAREQMALTARRTVEERFDITKNITLLENFYSEAMNLS